MKRGYESEEYKSVFGLNAPGDQDTTLLARPIPNTEYYDRASVYPFSVDDSDWTNDPDDKDCVTTTIITNPLSKNLDFYAGNDLSGRSRVYKQHSVVSLKDLNLKNLPENHRRNIKKGDSTLGVAIAPNPVEWHDYLVDMYPNLVERHGINGLTNYTPEQLKTLLETPGAILFNTFALSPEGHSGALVNMSLFYVDGNNAYYHLSAQDPSGYKMASNYTMMWWALTFFKSLGLDRVEIGSVPDGGSEGLRRFKEGFATKVIPNYLTRRIHRPDIYEQLCANIEDNGYFPLYRKAI